MTQPVQSPAADLGAQFLALNPHLRPGSQPANGEGGVATCGRQTQALRVIQSGGDFAKAIRHPIFTPLEQLWRKLPDDGIFEATPSNPSMIEIGAFQVPANQSLILGEFVFQPFRYNGVIANDLLPLEQQRLPTAIGYDLNFSQFRKGNLTFEIIPTNAPQNSRAAFLNPNPFTTILQGPTVQFDPGPIADLYDEEPDVPDTPDAIFNRAQSTPTSSPAGAALIPPTERSGQGPENFPFTYIVNENDVVQIRVYIFQPLSVPIAFFQASISGYLVSTQRLEMLLKGMEPCW